MSDKKTWLVYLLSGGDTGSEGWSGWMYYAIAFGNTDEEIYNSYVENVKKIYGLDFSQDLVCKDSQWSCYWPLAKTELPVEIYGSSGTLDMKF